MCELGFGKHHCISYEVRLAAKGFSVGLALWYFITTVMLRLRYTQPCTVSSDDKLAHGLLKGGVFREHLCIGNKLL